MGTGSGIFLTVCGFALLFAVAGLLLREFGFRGAAIFAALGGVLLLSGYLRVFSSILTQLNALTGRAGLAEAASDVMRVVGVGVLCAMTADVCEELGEKTTARVVVLAGKTEIFLLVIPYFTQAVEVGLALLREGGA